MAAAVKLAETSLKSCLTFGAVAGAAPTTRLGGQRARPVLR